MSSKLYIGYILCLCTLLFFPASKAVAQEKKAATVTVEGIVIDEENHPMSGITVEVQEKQTNAVTGSDGRFYMLLQPGDVLIVNLKGYRPVIERLSKKMSYTLKMHKLLLHEDDFIPVAYGEQSRRSLTSAVASIGAAEIEKNSVTSIEQAMNGTLSGLYSPKSGGEKFGASNYNFYIRGKATNADAQPLILVDDVETNIDMMDFNEVESISVLKDASALAMYGMRGANGVILIKTKHGSEVKHSLRVDIRAGMQQAARISNRLNAYQYTTLYNEALVNDGERPMYDPSVYQSANRDAYLYPDEDLKERFLGSTSPFQHYNFSASGGNSTAQYFVTAGYMKQSGILKEATAGTNYERFNFRSNVDVNLTKALSFNVLVSAAMDKNRTPYRDKNENYDTRKTLDFIFNTMITQPANAFPLFNENGSLGGNSDYQINPYGLLNRSGSRKDENRQLTAQIKGKYDFSDLLSGLSVDAAYSFENYNRQYLTVSHSYAVFQKQKNDTYTQFGLNDNKDTRNAGLMTGFYRRTSFSAAANYLRSLGENNDVAVRLLYNHSIETAAGDTPDYKYQALALRGQYGFMKRYYAELTGSLQGSNNYRSGIRSGLFPAVGLSWIASEETWLRNVEAVDFLKLRTSFGLNGNDRTNGGRFPYRQAFNSDGGYGFGNPNGASDGSTEGTLANADATWEKSTKFNIGFDLELWKGLSITADFFNELRSDLLVTSSNQIPSLIGIALPKINGGKVKNQGIDLNARYSKQFNNWGFFFGGNMLWAKNEVIDLKEIIYLYNHQYRKGHAVDAIFGYQTNGVYTDPSQLVHAPVGAFGAPQLGDLMYVNQNPGDDNIIDERDQVYIGNSFPELIFGGTLGVNYRGFDLQCNLEGASNYVVQFVPNKFTPYAYDNRWDPSNPTQTTAYPRLSITNQYNEQTSDFWQESGNLLRISSAELGYTLPKRVIRKIHLSNIRLYINANNLCSFSNLKDNRNPEAINAGYSEYPLLRTYSFGISIQL